MKILSLLLILAVASTVHGAKRDKDPKAAAEKQARKAKDQSWLKPTGPEPPADRCTAQSLRLAIDDLATTFGARYPRADQYRARLNQVETLQDEKARQEALTALAREALLTNPLLDFDRLLAVRRNLGSRARQAIGGALGQPTLNSRTLDTQTQPGTGWNDAIVEISNLRGSPDVRPIYEPVQNRIIAEMDLHFDGERIMFSSGNEQDHWNVYEIKEGDAQPTQLTPDVPDVAFFDSCYLPDGKIALTSTAVYQGIPCQNGKGASAVLYRLDPATKEIRQLTFEQDSDWCPTVTNDGRIMYLRWEYTDLPHYFSRILFACNPDGTGQMALYGSNSYFPNAFYSARPIPGHPTRVIGVASGHHGVPRSGRLLLIDPGQGRAKADGVVQEIPGYGKPVEPIIRDRLVDGVWPQFLCPYPLSNNYHIVSMKRSAGSLWGLYLVDVFDNMLLLAETQECALLDPIPYRSTTTPPVIPDRIDLTKKTATVLLSDVYFGPGLEGVPRGTVKRLRLFSYHFAHLGRGGHTSVGAEAGWDVKRILGTVPVDGDGSALFTIPANTPISVQPLDEKGRALQLMRSWLVGMPGEVVSCNGCHEDTSLAPPKPQPTGAFRKPSRITQWYGPPRPFAFESEVRPVLDKYCVGCHDGSQRGVSNLAKGNAGSYKADASYMTLQKYVRRPGPESDIHLTTPLEYHASTSELIQMLEKGHHNVQLDEEAWSRLTTWIDLNVPHRGSWQPAEFGGVPQQERRVELASTYAGVDLDMEAEFTSVLESALSRPKPEPIMPEPLPEFTPREIEVPGWPFKAEDPADSADIVLDLGEGVTMQLVSIPAGRFIMGSATGSLDERPRAAVAIDKPFWMGRVEVTNQQFLRFDPNHESKYIDLGGKDHGTRGVPANGPQQPVIRVSWQQAMAFCRWLSEKTGRRVTLPTEAQWEWACRAGTATPLWFGNLDASYSNCANLVESAGYYSHNYSRGRVKAGNVASVPVTVGSYESNRWRLHDTHGNVAEWTRSSYRPYPYVADDGRNDLDSTERKAVRGGSWCDRPTRATSSFRLAYQPWQKVVDVGFRVIVEPVTREPDHNTLLTNNRSIFGVFRKRYDLMTQSPPKTTLWQAWLWGRSPFLKTPTRRLTSVTRWAAGCFASGVVRPRAGQRPPPSSRYHRSASSVILSTSCCPPSTSACRAISLPVRYRPRPCTPGCARVDLDIHPRSLGPCRHLESRETIPIWGFTPVEYRRSKCIISATSSRQRTLWRLVHGLEVPDDNDAYDQDMTEQQDLLEAAQKYCDPKTGEVLERIPGELMKKLRAAKLAKGIRGKPSQRTDSSATWFVLLNSEIRDRILALRRRSKGIAKRDTVKTTQGKATVDEAATEVVAKPSRGENQGLGRFLERRKADQ